jgi:hypothetical protein
MERVEVETIIKELNKYRHIDPVIEKSIKLIIEISKNYKFKKRSKSQNAYLWELIGKLADVLRIGKDELYIHLLEEYGQGDYIKIKSNVNPKNYFKYYKEVGKDNDCTFYKVYRGSSEYDSKEMSILIDGLIQECREQNIDTLTPEEIAKMKIN